MFLDTERSIRKMPLRRQQFREVCTTRIGEEHKIVFVVRVGLCIATLSAGHSWFSVWATFGIRCFFSLGLCLRSPRGATDVNDETWSMKLYLPKVNKTRHHLSIMYFENLGKWLELSPVVHVQSRKSCRGIFELANFRRLLFSPSFYGQVWGKCISMVFIVSDLHWTLLRWSNYWWRDGRDV